MELRFSNVFQSCLFHPFFNNPFSSVILLCWNNLDTLCLLHYSMLEQSAHFANPAKILENQSVRINET